MHLLHRRLLPAALLLIGAASAQANDIALPSLTPSQRLLLDSAFDSAESVQVLGMEQVDVWERIRKGFAIPDLDNQLVGNQMAWYTARPDYIQRTTTRASRYLFHVVTELEKRNMPTELALLPFIESAFNPQALSTAKAAGMWQFIPSTGLDYKLKQNIFKDERRDVLASTDAALTYLQRLHGMFGDWQLALAAYNWGEGNVQRAINKQKAAGGPIDYNSMSHLMPAETRNYVPKLQAVKNIVATPDQYGLALPKVDNAPYFVTIGKTRDIDIKVAAQLAELSVDEFKALNPQFNRPVIVGSADTRILLPQSNAEKFKANLSNWTRALSSWTAHKVTAAREKIETIAARFGTTPQVIREVNQIPPRTHLKAGSTILVPKTEDTPEKDISAELADAARLIVAPDAPATRRIAVKVGKRDTLAAIARRHGVSVAQIRDWNGLRQDKVAAGTTLRLEVANKAASRRGAGKPIPAYAAKADTRAKATSKVAVKADAGRSGRATTTRARKPVAKTAANDPRTKKRSS